MHAFLATLGVLTVYFPIALYLRTMPAPDPTILRPPFERAASNAYLSYHLVSRARADAADEPERSTVQLYEDDRLLGPAHSPHDDIAQKGHGRYSFWKDRGAYLIFSTSDNSDPNTNGRTYRAIDPEARDPYLAPQQTETAARQSVGTITPR